MQRIAIAGIHTDAGKTIVAAVLAEALGADYWKPVQAGGLDNSDTMVVRSLVSEHITIHPEALRLQMAASPHTAAAQEGITIDYTQFAWPGTNNTLLVETAGGLLSPMSNDSTMADFISHYKMPAFLVTRHYLGSINHTLLCVEVMKQRGIQLLGMIVSGDRHEPSESFIRSYTGINNILHVPQLAQVSRAAATAAAIDLRSQLSGIPI
jgi:dethiobiotin synthetase